MGYPYLFDSNTGNGMDLFTRLLQDRIILVFEGVSDELSCSVIAQLLYLESQDPNKDIYMYINSPGGSVSSGLAIYDAMRHCKCPINTICCGTAASMGAFLLTAGTKGKRYVFEHSQVMIHKLRVHGYIYGQASDVEISNEHSLRLQEILTKTLADNTGHTVEEMNAMTDRDGWYFGEEAIAAGLVDHMIRDVSEARGNA
jgi:ATP-dependent Clp protease protease subunit